MSKGFHLVFGVLAIQMVWGIGSVWAADKIFSGSSDGTTWHDVKNWLPEGIPGATDAVLIDLSAAAVTVSKKDFLAGSITVGGKAVSGFSVESFVYGTLTPSSNSDPAILIRRDGVVTLQGEGTVTAHGPFKNTEEALSSEPSVMVLLE